MLQKHRRLTDTKKQLIIKGKIGISPWNGQWQIPLGFKPGLQALNLTLIYTSPTRRTVCINPRRFISFLDCDNPPILQHGVFNASSGTDYPSEAFLVCDNGARPGKENQTRIVCEANGDWTTTHTTCFTPGIDWHSTDLLQNKLIANCIGRLGKPRLMEEQKEQDLIRRRAKCAAYDQSLDFLSHMTICR